jgi:hypothetical protein
LAIQKEKPCMSPTHVFLIGGNPPAIEIVLQSSMGPTNRLQRPSASSFKKNTLLTKKELAECPKSSKRKSCCQQQSPECFLLIREAQPSRSDQRSFSHPQCQHPEISISFLSGRASPASSSLSVSSGSGLCS